MPGTVPPPPEYSLLLDASVPVARLRSDFDGWDGAQWGRTLSAADWHRLSPLVFTHLSQRGGAPAAVVSALERTYLGNVARSLFIRTAVDDVVGRLTAAGVPALLLKGAALAETVYPDPAQREMLDIDVLVARDRLTVATAALGELGYRPAPAGNSVAGSTQLEGPPHHDPALIGREQLVAVELHHHVAIEGEGSGFSTEGLWERSRTLASTGHLVPAPEDLLIHICFHFTRNRLGGSADRRNTGGALGQICDIERVVSGEDVDWPALVATSREYGLGARVFLALFAAHELGVAVPASTLGELEPAGFNHELGRRLVALRVLRGGDHLPVRSLRWMFAPNREALSRGWNADPTATLSLAGAYLRRARAHSPAARAALRRPWVFVQDRRLNGQIRALEEQT
jgi:hypothetical protein